MPKIVARLALLCVLLTAILAQPSRAEDRLLLLERQRVQEHGNRQRGLAYMLLSQRTPGAEPATFDMKPILQVPLDGDRTTNVRGNLLPIDVDGTGTFGFLHYNGYRVMRVFDHSGRKLWQISNPQGRVHRTYVHRDAIAVLDTDGDGRQEILHCWLEARTGRRLLVRRDGRTGVVLASTPSADGATSECQEAVFRFAGTPGPILLVARTGPPAAGCGNGGIDTWDAVTAYDMNLRYLWSSTTCNAGHYVWPLDANGDGAPEAVFIGKYLFDAQGRLLCTLPGWGHDHVDSMVVGDLDPLRAGVEVLAVGATGTRFYSATGCLLRWTIPNRVIRNPQQTRAVTLAPGAAPTLFVRQRGSEPKGTTYRISSAGRVIGAYADQSPLEPMPQQNANLDGAAGSEDLLAWFGQVLSPTGARRLGVEWYWNLRPLLPSERAVSAYDHWASAALAFDLNGDGRDELTVWGRDRIVVGTRK
ncbi:MAG: hypothetical protein U1E45_12720 [Geminicoccaceae bacterium]